MPNPGVVALPTIRTAAADRADMPTPSTTTFITTATWLTYINSSYAELYDLLIQKFGDDYFAALDTNGNPYRLTTNGTADKYPLPDGSSTCKMPDTTTTAPGFYKLLAVDVYLSGTDPSSAVRVHPFNFADRNEFNSPALPAWGSRTIIKYKLLSNFIWFIPKPQASQTMALWYAPRLTALSADGDTLDGVSGWEEYIVVDAARKAAIKEESYELADRLKQDKAELRQRIEEAAESRDAGSSGTVADTREDY